MEQPPRRRDQRDAVGNGGLQRVQHGFDRTDMAQLDIPPDVLDIGRGGGGEREGGRDGGGFVADEDPVEIELAGDRVEQRVEVDGLGQERIVQALPVLAVPRSEERRVGKECRL